MYIVQCTYSLLYTYRNPRYTLFPPNCILGWVNLYQKLEIEKYTVCGKLILPKKWKGIC